MLQNAAPVSRGISENQRSRWPIVMLLHRTVLFLLWQAVIAAAYLLVGEDHPWTASAAWWPISATLTNLTSVLLLRWLAAREGLRYAQLINADFRREHLAKDLLIMLGVLLLVGPIGMLPDRGLGQLLFGDPQAPVAMMIRPLPPAVALVGMLSFPLSIAFAELPTYFGYVMPRLANRWSGGWAILVSGLWLGFQHATLPFLADGRFFLWRLLMFVPFALYVGAVIRWRPRLLPYLMIVHVLLDLAAGAQVYLASIGR